jgi:AraC-like DNA-binding protein
MDDYKKVKETHSLDLQLEHNFGADWIMNYYHFHNVYEIYLAMTPGAEMWIGNQRFVVAANDLFLINPSNQHRVIIHDRTGYERYILYFHPLYIHPLCTSTENLLECFGSNQQARVLCLKLSQVDVSKLISLYAHMSDLEMDSSTYAREIKRKILMAEILILINEIYIDQIQRIAQQNLTSPFHQTLMPIIEYIERHYKQQLDTQQTSELFGLNRHKMNHLFKEITGISFHQYLVNTRIIKAKELLLQEGISTTEACYESGFNDYAHFIRTFSNTVGMSPRKYARQYQSNNNNWIQNLKRTK